MNFELGAHVQIIFFFNMECFSIGSHTCEDTPSIMRFGKSMLKNYHVNVRMATVLICSGGCLLQQMRGNGLAYMLVCLSLVLCLPSSSTHARQLKKEDPVGLRHCH